jgi:single-strand DNA-binding protein
MLNGATVTLKGYVATEPVYRTINDTTPKVYMRVGWSSRYQDRVTGEWRDGDSSFATVSCWRRLASNVAPSLRKGEAIVVTGRLTVREFDDKEGRHRVIVDIDADAIGHDLSRGVTHFQRTLRSAGEEAALSLPDGLARSGAAGDEVPRGDLAGADSLGRGHAEQGPVGEGGLFDQDAVDALAEKTGEPVAVGAPF